MRASRTTYIDTDGKKWPLTGFDAGERRLFAELKERARRTLTTASEPIQRWCEFDNYWLPRVHTFYSERGLTRKQVMNTAIFQITHDLSGRLAIMLGLARKADYRDQLIEIIEERFKTRRAFCKATGLAEDMLSHVLAGRKHLSIEALTIALDRIGYSIEFVSRETKASKSA